MCKDDKRTIRKPKKSIIIVAIGVFLLTCCLSALAGGVFLFRQFGSQLRQDQGMVVACVGDSITYGLGVRKLRIINSYPAILQRMLGIDYRVINFGVSGASLSDAGFHPYQETQMFSESISSNPQVVLIMLGTNDAWQYSFDASMFEEQLIAMINLYQDLPSQPTVYLLTPPDAFAIADPEIIEHELVPIIFRVGGQMGVEVVDVFSATREQKQYFTSDEIHPNVRGNRLIAKLVFQAIKY